MRVKLRPDWSVISAGGKGGPQAWFAHRSIGWISKGVIATLDQAVFSTSSFLVNILLARWLQPEEYGLFSIGYAVIVLLLGVHNALVLEPMSILGPSRYRDRITSYLRVQLRVHAVVTGSVALLLAAAAALSYTVGRRSTASLILVLAITLPLLGLGWLGRRFFYVLGQPGKALEVSGLNLLACALLVLALKRLNALRGLDGVWILAVAGLGAGLWAVFRLRAASGAGGGNAFALPDILKEQWTLGRWQVYALPIALASQALVWVPAALLGLAEVAAARALSNLVLPLQQTATALYSLALPALAASFSRDSAERFKRKAFWVLSGTATLAFAYAGLVALTAAPVEGVLYKGRYEGYAWLGPFLALDAALGVWGQGQSVLLKAMGRMDMAALSGSLTAIALLTLSSGLTYVGGLKGLVAGTIASRTLALCLNTHLLRRAFSDIPG